MGRLAGLGCKIVIHGRREEGPAEYGEGTTLTAVAAAITARFGVESMKVLGDLTVAADVDNVVKEVLDQWGKIDILVHNAGGDIAAAGGKPNPNDAIHVKDEDVIAVMGKNLNSTILINQRVQCEAAAAANTAWCIVAIAQYLSGSPVVAAG